MPAGGSAVVLLRLLVSEEERQLESFSEADKPELSIRSLSTLRRASTAGAGTPGSLLPFPPDEEYGRTAKRCRIDLKGVERFMERITKFFTSLGGVLTSLAAIVGGVVALYVAFGGGKSSNPPPPPAVTTTSNAALEDWRSDAESICRVADSQVIALGPSPAVTDDSDTRITWIQNVIPIVATYTNQLRALDKPAEAQVDIDRLLDTMDKVTDSGQTMVNAYQALDIETTNTARLELQGAIDDMQRQMAELGLKRCLTI